MKPEQSLSTIFRQLRPALRSPHVRVPRYRRSIPTAAFHQSTLWERPSTTQICQHHHPFFHTQHRCNSTSASTLPTSVPLSTTTQPPTGTEGAPAYELTFTCKPCHHRSTHRVSQQGYKHGTVLIACPSCKNRHVFADHLKIFADKSFTIEDLMREKGELVKRGTLEGDLELWDDGTRSERATV